MTRKPTTARQVAPVDIDLDALLQQQEPAQPVLRTIRLFGEVHTVISPQTPAGVLQVMQWRRSLLLEAQPDESTGDEGKSMAAARMNVLTAATALEALIPSLAKHREKLLNLTYAQIKSITEAIHLDELLDDVLVNLGIQPPEQDTEPEGAEGN